MHTLSVTCYDLQHLLTYVYELNVILRPIKFPHLTGMSAQTPDSCHLSEKRSSQHHQRNFPRLGSSDKVLIQFLKNFI